VFDVEGLRFSYALHELPPGRLPFRRWRWELWHGSTLHAAGWRAAERDALRALGTHAARVGYALFGLRAAGRPAPAIPRDAKPGMTIRLRAGDLALSLTPVSLEVPDPVVSG
jgi:hypothetical protein